MNLGNDLTGDGQVDVMMQRHNSLASYHSFYA